MSGSPVDALRGCRAYVAAHHDIANKVGEIYPVVTISREVGAGALSVAEIAANLLNERRKNAAAPPWTVFDRNLVERVLEDHRLPTQLKRFMPEDVKDFVTDAVEEMFGLHPSSWNLVQHTADTILRLARLGNVILVGRGANFIAAGVEAAVHVRLVAPLEKRVRYMERFKKITHDEALDLVRTGDRARSRYVRRYFDADIADPLNYSMTINTGRIGFHDAAQLIAEAVHRAAENARNKATEAHPAQ